MPCRLRTTSHAANEDRCLEPVSKYLGRQVDGVEIEFRDRDMLEKKPLEAVGHALGGDILTEHSLNMLSLSGFSIFIQDDHPALGCAVQGSQIVCRDVTLLCDALYALAADRDGCEIERLSVVIWICVTASERKFDTVICEGKGR